MVPLDPEAQQGALAALRASLDVERDLLKTQQDHYRQAAAERDAAEVRVDQLLIELDAMAVGAVPAPAESVAAKDREMGEADQRRALAIHRCREILARMQELQDRISGLEKKISGIRGNLPKLAERLSGSWRIILLPSNNRGSFVLRQTGTIVQGQYQLDGGWTGSLQGTFINGKVHMQRIDSKLGRNSELEGFLDKEGSSIRGTWRSFGLADGEVSMGSWTATRQEE